MGLCCCFRNKNRDSKRQSLTSTSDRAEAPNSEREVLRNRENTYTTAYLSQYSEDNRISSQTIANIPESLNNYNWYYGIISRIHAHELLRHEEDGTFLVRSSTDSEPQYPYIISVKHKPQDGTNQKENYHYRIRSDENGYFTLGWNLYFKNVKDLLDYYKGKTDILKVPLRKFIDHNQSIGY